MSNLETVCELDHGWKIVRARVAEFTVYFWLCADGRKADSQMDMSMAAELVAERIEELEWAIGLLAWPWDRPADPETAESHSALEIDCCVRITNADVIRAREIAKRLGLQEHEYEEDE